MYSGGWPLEVPVLVSHINRAVPVLVSLITRAVPVLVSLITRAAPVFVSLIIPEVPVHCCLKGLCLPIKNRSLGSVLHQWVVSCGKSKGV